MHNAHAAAHTAVVPGIHPKAPRHPNTVGMPLHMHQTSAHTTVATVVHTTTQRHQDLPSLGGPAQTLWSPITQQLLPIQRPARMRRQPVPTVWVRCSTPGQHVGPLISGSSRMGDPQIYASPHSIYGCTCSTAATGSFIEKPFVAAPTMQRLSQRCRTTTRPALVTSPSCL